APPEPASAPGHDAAEPGVNADGGVDADASVGTGADVDGGADAAASATPDAGAAPPASAAPPPPPLPVPANLDEWVLGGPSLSARLLPLVAAHPELLDGSPRARRWADRLLVEDPTSQDVLEIAALVFGRAGRFGGTDRMLMELTYYTPDR